MRWIGAPDADKPAPQVQAHRRDDRRPRPAPRQQANPQPAPAAASTDGGSSDTLSIVALIVGALGLVVAGIAVAMARGSRSAVR